MGREGHVMAGWVGGPRWASVCFLCSFPIGHIQTEQTHPQHHQTLYVDLSLTPYSQVVLYTSEVLASACFLVSMGAWGSEFTCRRGWERFLSAALLSLALAHFVMKSTNCWVVCDEVGAQPCKP
jgi:hypothetical protein